MSERLRATLIGYVAVMLWGLLALLTRLTGGQIPPFQLLAMTFGIAFMLMCLNWWRRGVSGLAHARQPWQAWVIGVGGYFGYHFCYFLAMSKAPAVEVSLLAYLWPLLIVLFASLLPGERLLKRYLLGAVVALFGCWLLVGGKSGGFSPEYLSGYLLALACALIWSSYSVLSRLVSRVPTDAVGWFCAVTALLALPCHLLWETTVWPESAMQWLGIIGLGIGPMGIAFFTWDYGIKHGNLSLLGVLAYSAPLISTLVLVLAGMAENGPTLWLACAAIVAGSLIAGWQGRR
ncbi:MAG: EamA family transporter [Thiothrix sp.]|nr:EamA family transporter [Thiothrix sp.]HPE60197.1 EamA family transporter [Thiolinea sp.]